MPQFDIAIDLPLHEAFAERVALHPDRVAIRSGETVLTYAELNSRAERWADFLWDRGMRPKHIVPVVARRSAELVVAVLAVLKTGAAYALLDPTWPIARLEEVVGLLPTPLVIDMSGQGLIAGVPTWRPETLSDQPVSSQPSDVRSAVTAAAAACVFFTSGSTGVPKGAVVPHQAISRLFREETFVDVGPDLVIPLAAATPWDAFAFELWAALLSGGTGVVVEEPFITPAILRSLISCEGVNTAWLTSSLFNMIVEEDLGAFAGLRQLLIGGERLSETHVSAFERANPAVALINGYGPVESTVFASTHRIAPADTRRPGGIPLGTCVPGTDVFVLDGDRECGRDEVGEICISGHGLAIGYLNDPELTAERFPDITLRGRRQRVYRTGDRGVWASPDGLLEFRGRIDRQLKIRGHRVDLEEIEALVPRLCREVAACRAVARVGIDGTSSLVAFCVPRDAESSLDQVRSRLAERLPTHQVPSRVVSIDDFPLTERGKVDERALLQRLDPPEGEIPAAPGPLAATSMLHVVQNVFATFVGARVAPGTSFFAAGGTSLDAGRACARLGAHLGIDVPVSILYQQQSAGALAAWLDSAREPAPGTTTTDDAGPAVLTGTQESFLLRDIVDPTGRTNHCLLVWQVRGDLDLDALADAIVMVQRHHPALRSAYSLDAPVSIAPVTIEDPPLVVLPSESDPDAALRSLLSELTQPLNPPSGQVWAVALAPVEAGSSAWLGCVVHHVAFDGWSEAVLADDLSRCYNGDEPSPYAGWMHGSEPVRPIPNRDRALRDQVGRLADHVRHATPLGLAVTQTQPVEPSLARTSPVGAIRRRLDAQHSALAGALAGASGATLFHVLLCAWGGALHEVLEASDPVIGVPVSTRNRRDQDHVIGCHIAVVPIRLELAAAAGSTSMLERVAAVRDAARVAMACQDAPLSAVIRSLGPDLRGPLYDSLFAWHDVAVPTLALTGVDCVFERQPYVELPTPLHCEAWRAEDGSIDIDVSFVRAALDDAVAVDLADRMLEQLAAMLAGVQTEESM